MGIFNQTQVTSKKDLDLLNNFVYPEEKIIAAFKGLRDMVAITDKRILNVDRQGTTGKRKTIMSVRLNSIFNVNYEFETDGINSHNIIVYFIKSPNLKSKQPAISSTRIKLNQKDDSYQEVYQYLAKIAETNFDRINK